MYGLKRKAEHTGEDARPHKETLAHKMIRDLIGIDPAEIIVEFNKIADQIKAGVAAMEATSKSVASLDQRLSKVENSVARIEQNITKEKEA